MGFLGGAGVFFFCLAQIYPCFVGSKVLQYFLRGSCWQCGVKSQPSDNDFSFISVTCGSAQK